MERPKPDWECPPGYHHEAVEESFGRWQCVVGMSEAGRKCRMLRCQRRAVAKLLRSRTGSPKGCWWYYCERHLYGRWVEDGKVMTWRAVPDGPPPHDYVI